MRRIWCSWGSRVSGSTMYIATAQVMILDPPSSVKALFTTVVQVRASDVRDGLARRRECIYRWNSVFHIGWSD